MNNMNEKEFAEIIGIKLFGFQPNNIASTFNPLKNEADCMQAWENFSKKKLTCINYYKDKEWLWEACVDGLRGQDDCILAESTDRKRAMCECMVKTLKIIEAEGSNIVAERS